MGSFCYGPYKEHTCRVCSIVISCRECNRPLRRARFRAFGFRISDSRALDLEISRFRGKGLGL